MAEPQDKLGKMLQPSLPQSRLRPQGMVHVHLQVSDMKRSIDFYVKVLGFFYDHGIREAAWLRLRNLLLTISPGEPGQISNAYFGWTADSFAELEQTFDRLYRSGQRLSSPPQDSPGRSYFFLYDPDDYPIVFSFQELEYPGIFEAQGEEGNTGADSAEGSPEGHAG